MRILLGAALGLVSVSVAYAQSADGMRMVPMNDTERKITLEMCDLAQWAARQRFDGFCEYLKVKFNNSQPPALPKSADPPGESAPEKPAEPAQPPK